MMPWADSWFCALGAFLVALWGMKPESGTFKTSASLHSPFSPISDLLSLPHE